MIFYYLRWGVTFDVVVKVSREDLYLSHGDVNKPKKWTEECCLGKSKQNGQP